MPHAPSASRVRKCLDQQTGYYQDMICSGRLSIMAVSAAAPVLLLSGCASESARDVGTTMAAFSDAVTSGDTSRACELLATSTRSELESSTGKSCPKALAAELPSVGERPRIQVYGNQAIARTTHDAEFLARYDDGWRVTAAGCKPKGHDLYDCPVKKG
jgi:hypothetical protein